MSDICPIHGTEYETGRNMANAPVGRYCSYDGSMHPDEFMVWLEQPGTQLTPTDKNYKVYIDVDSDEDPAELRVVSVIGFEPAEKGPPWPFDPANPGDWRRVSPEDDPLLLENGWRDHSHYTWIRTLKRGSHRESKFYFEHLSDEQKTRFVELLNEGKLSLRAPGYFYRLPFFIQ